MKHQDRIIKCFNSNLIEYIEKIKLGNINNTTNLFKIKLAVSLVIVNRIHVVVYEAFSLNRSFYYSSFDTALQDLF